MRQRGVAALFATTLVVLLLASAGVEAAYRTETTAIGTLTAGVVAPERALDAAEAWMAKVEDRMEGFVAAGEAGPIENELLLFYRGATAGMPRLFFGEDGPLGWFVPMVKGSEIVGLYIFDPYSGTLKATPWWGAGGTAGMHMREQEWNELESIIVPWVGSDRIEQARLVLIPGRESAVLYVAAPGPAGVARVDVSSIWSREGLMPHLLDTQPQFEPKGGVPFDDTRNEAPLISSAGLDLDDLPATFTLAVLPKPKDQCAYGSCTGHAAHSVAEWWECGNICYEGTGNSELFTCDCPKGYLGDCACISKLLSREFMYDRTRNRVGDDCLLSGFCASRSCAQGTCTSLYVTDGDMIQSNPYCHSCSGAAVLSAATVLVNEGVCTEACQPYPNYGYAGPQHGGCTNGGRSACSGVCPNVGDPCGDDYILAEYEQHWSSEEIFDALYHRGPVMFGANLCNPCWVTSSCMCDPCPCPAWGGHAMMFCGYDNAFHPETFYVQNSWGTSWGTLGRANTTQAWWEGFSHPGDTYSFLGVKLVDLELDPHGITYHRGETLSYTGTLRNLTGEVQSLYVRADVTLPNGNPFPGNPVLGPIHVTLQPYAVLNRDIQHFIPYSAPFGFYGYKVKVYRLAPNITLDEATFAFSVMPGQI